MKNIPIPQDNEQFPDREAILTEIGTFKKRKKSCKTVEDLKNAGMIIDEEEFWRSSYKSLPFIFMLKQKDGNFTVMRKANTPEGWMFPAWEKNEIISDR